MSVVMSRGRTAIQQLEATFSDTSPATATTAASATTATGMSIYDNFIAIATLTGATGGTLDVYLQTSFDDGTTWYDYAAFPQKAAASGATYHTAHGALTGAVVTIGKDLTPLLAASSCTGGPWGKKMRVVYKAGAGTSVGAAQVIKLYGVRIL